MGMFNSIVADLRCPTIQEVGIGTEIQIKWQVQEARELTVYHIGDVLEGLQAEYDNTWIRTDYICRICSKQSVGKNGITYIKTDDQQRHFVFVRIEHGKICRVLTEEEFEKSGFSSLGAHAMRGGRDLRTPRWAALWAEIMRRNLRIATWSEG